MKNNKWFWGLIILGAGVMLLLSALGIGENYGLFRVIGTALLLGISIESLYKSRFFLFPIPLALALYIWRVQIGYTELNITLLLAAAVLLGIGLSIIFHKKTHHDFSFSNTGDWKKSNSFSDSKSTQEVLTDNELVNLEANFSKQIKYIHAGNLKQANISSNFAEMSVYFDQCKVHEEGLKINISGNFTEIALHVPRDWRIENHVSIFAATIKGLNEHTSNGTANVSLQGSVNFGELKIIYI